MGEAKMRGIKMKGTKTRGTKMTQVTVKITGVANSAQWTWDQQLIPLVSTGSGNFNGALQSSPGPFIYSIIVFGMDGDAWTAAVSDGPTTQNFAGHMSPSGVDTTGDTKFTVH
jgi:hypothetical protein